VCGSITRELGHDICSRPDGTYNIYESFPADVTNGEGISAYNFRHGTNATVGGFELSGSATKRSNAKCECVITFNLMYYWNDIMDPNPRYLTDRVKSAFGEALTMGEATAYIIRIGWFQQSVYHVKCNGEVVESNWPFDPQIESCGG